MGIDTATRLLGAITALLLLPVYPAEAREEGPGFVLLEGPPIPTEAPQKAPTVPEEEEEIVWPESTIERIRLAVSVLQKDWRNEAAKDVLEDPGPLDAEVVPLLMEYLEDESFYDSKFFVQRLLEKTGVLAVPELLSRLRTGDDALQYDISEVLRRLPCAGKLDALPVLLELLDEERVFPKPGMYSGRTHAYCTDTAFKGLLCNSPTVKELLEAAGSHPYLIRQIAPYLGRVSPFPADELRPALDDANEHIRTTAITAYGQSEEAVREVKEVLVKALQDDSPGVRSAAATILGTLGKESAPILGSALKDPSVSVRGSITQALARLGPDAKEAVPFMLQAGFDYSTFDTLRKILLDSPELIDIAALALEGGNQNSRYSAMMYLQTVGEDASRVAPILLEQLKRQPEDERTAQVLARIAPRDEAVMRAIVDLLGPLNANSTDYYELWEAALSLEPDPIEGAIAMAQTLWPSGGATNEVTTVAAAMDMYLEQLCSANTDLFFHRNVLLWLGRLGSKEAVETIASFEACAKANAENLGPLYVSGDPPGIDGIGFYRIHSIAKCMDESEKEWHLLVWRGLGGNGLFIAGTEPDQIKGQLVFIDGSLGDNFDLHRISSTGGLEFRAKEGRNHLFELALESRRFEIDLDACMQDEDGDGLADRVEARLGTDPKDPDSDGDGKNDGLDGNPLMRPAAGPSDIQEIQQAVFTVLFASYPMREVLHIVDKDGSMSQEFKGYQGPVIHTTAEQRGTQNFLPIKIQFVSETQATAEISTYFGPTAAEGYEATLKKLYGKWIVVQLRGTWVS